ncbi:sulfate reduction electron transfer complex DsrMKJOP subunit DsrM [Desulfofustis limnaeus]|jgi:nitrate reductase gamma subunit|uniref:Menaquinol oxidoreductase n=1 Tax=Desulfofustis limnaeus TaxID=2740163 RepID=A0ABM7WAV3_9BACT|nr:sulfate reduction electron transfer complex DsrMKJOP subunit DsrM [Desulfofustis limnaeus]MDX9896779.1 sulfate reduction electron transfer complex DsrMKJOP subunit DsrM [Desulfofustis sp.]BDD88033.1 menaquinol oxidoreductase [Desulfofustis limnaeus]
MKYAYSFLAVIALILIAWLGSQIPGMQYFFGVAVPYLAIMVFLGGFVYRVVHWAKSPVPFSIQTTCGQAKSLDFIKHNRLEAPNTNAEVIARMALEILTFRSLFRNTKSEIYAGPKITYESSKWLWLFALAFHYSFFIIVIRHLRLFLNPVPDAIAWLDWADSMFEIGMPAMYLTDAGLLIGLIYLFGRRLVNRQVRYISLLNDYFPLLLLLGIGITGVLMRMFLREGVDINAIKQLAVGLATFSPVISGDIGSIFYIHLFLVSVLLIYFPFSKLMHLGGVFLSPTRNMRNNTREVRHVNPWNPDIKPHSYDAYEDEFRDFMVDAGIPVEKQPAPQKDE